MKEKTLAKIRKFYSDSSHEDMWVILEHNKYAMVDRGDFIQVLGVFEPDRKIRDAEKVLKKLNKKW